LETELDETAHRKLLAGHCEANNILGGNLLSGNVHGGHCGGEDESEVPGDAYISRSSFDLSPGICYDSYMLNKRDG
jgi:hypothetical protein